MTVKDLMEKYEVSKMTIYRWFKRGLEFSYDTTTGERIVALEDLEYFFQNIWGTNRKSISNI